MVKSARDVEAARGDGVKRPAAAEKTTRVNNRKSIVTLREIAAGEPVTPDALDIKRPGYGIAPKHWEAVVGKRAAADIKADEVLSWEMLG
jgi:sialic acid synthase SpsE